MTGRIAAVQAAYVLMDQQACVAKVQTLYERYRQALATPL